MKIESVETLVTEVSSWAILTWNEKGKWFTYWGWIYIKKNWDLETLKCENHSGAKISVFFNKNQYVSPKDVLM